MTVSTAFTPGQGGSDVATPNFNHITEVNASVSQNDYTDDYFVLQSPSNSTENAYVAADSNG